jgi:hypothetical protein
LVTLVRVALAACATLVLHKALATLEPMLLRQYL